MALGIGDGDTPELGMGLHRRPLVIVEAAGLQQDAVGNADLADVVQRRRLEQQVERRVVQLRGEEPALACRLRQDAQVMLGAANMIGGLVVTRLGQRGHGQDDRILGALRLLQRRRKRVHQGDIGHGDGRAVGHPPERADHLRGRAVPMRPIGADRGDGIVLSDRHHHQTAHEGWAIGLVRNPVIPIDILDDDDLAMPHRPAGNAMLHREALPLPERRYRILVSIVAAATIAQDEADPIGAGQPASTAAYNGHDLVDTARHRKVERKSVERAERRIGSIGR